MASGSRARTRTACWSCTERGRAGPEVWGVEAASQKYFSKPARRLTSSEAALLAATLPGPLRANPGYRAAGFAGASS